MTEKEAYKQIMKKKPKRQDVSKQVKNTVLLKTSVIAVTLIFIILMIEFKDPNLERIGYYSIAVIVICTFYFIHSFNENFNVLIYDKHLAWEKEVDDLYIKAIPRETSTKIYKVDLEKNHTYANVVFSVDGKLINRNAKIKIDENTEETYVSYIKIKHDIDSAMPFNLMSSNLYEAGDIIRVILHTNETELKMLIN